MATFSRKTLHLGEGGRSGRVTGGSSHSRPRDLHRKILHGGGPEESATVLVINASHEMAKEITLQLQLQIPGCSLMYAPTIDLAVLLLKKRRIDLIVSSPVLPDGSISKLKGVLHEIEDAPDLVVVGTINVENAEAVSELDYHYTAMRSLREANPAEGLDSSLKVLGADIRNDINNPLQEIVAMVFVAKTAGQSPMTGEALDAIERAAKNLSKLVWSLEDKIRGAVLPRVANYSR